jgi:hypothetical protein
MQRKYQLIFLDNSEDPSTFTVDEKKYAAVKIPDEKREVSFDDILLREIQDYWALQALSGKEITDQSYVDVLDYLTTNLQTHRDMGFVSNEFQILKKQTEAKKHRPALFHSGSFLENQNELTDPLAHVRQCEDSNCSLNCSHSRFAKDLNDNVSKEVKRVLGTKGSVKEDAFFYGGFASNLLLRDLKILRDILPFIKHCKDFTFIFYDKGYKNLGKWASGEPHEFKMDEQVQLNIQMKAIQEFASWMSTQTQSKLPVSVSRNFLKNTPL